jgi:DNA ligase-associated metallophosphoesterase
VTPTPIVFAGQPLLLDPRGAVFWPARRTLIVADLHLEKASSYAARGAMLPPYDSGITLDLLARLVRHFAPERVIALGDTFHDSEGARRLGGPDRALFEHIMSCATFVWITGNHDPLMPAELRGLIAEEFREAGLAFRHVAASRPHPVAARHGELSGHYHPKARIQTRAKAIVRRCFVLDQHRLMLPALGAYSGGLDVTAPPIRALFPHGARLFLLSENRLFTFSLSNNRMESA